MATSSMAGQIGRVLGGRYRLVAPIGTGASAQVFLADDISLRRRVAVKVLHAALAEDETFLRRFRAEAQQAAALTHPNIMRVFDWGESESGPYLVLEHLAGGSLRDLLDTDVRLTPSQALLVGLEAARALDYAHRRGLAHRDIKPANLLFDDEGRVCIADFGLARALAEAAWTEPVGIILGTARYASPEQAQGASVDGKADVYALGLVLVEAVTGRVPFTADTTIATLMARVGARLEAPPEMGPLGPIVEKAAATEAPDRLDAGQLARALEEVARQMPAPEPFRLARRPASSSVQTDDHRRPNDITELGTAAVPVVPAVPGSGQDDDTVVTAAPAAPYLHPQAQRRRRRRWPWALFALVLGALGSGATYLVVQARIPSHPVPALRNLTVAEAVNEVADEKFTVKVARSEYHDEVPKDRVIEQDPSSLATLREGQTIKLVVSKGGEPRQVPDLNGLDQAAAEQALVALNLVPKFTPVPHEDIEAGRVIDWSPTGMSTKNSEVAVNVSAGPPPRRVPELSGRSFEEASNLLKADGLKVARDERYSDEVKPGIVISTNPGAGGQATKGSTVTVAVSKGPNVVKVPAIVGKTVDQARALLAEAGLKVDQVFPPIGNRVLFSDPQPGTEVRRGTSVTLFVR